MGDHKSGEKFSGATRYILDDELAKIVNISMALEMPLLLKGVLVGVVMFFIMAFQEISTAIFLYRGGWETLPIGIYLNWHRGMEFGIAAAMAFLMIVITFILLLIISRIGGGVLKAAWGSGEQ